MARSRRRDRDPAARVAQVVAGDGPQGQAAADVAAAKAAVATAGINLGYTKVVAPIGGRSSISQVTQGAYVQGSAATLLTTVQQIDPIYANFSQAVEDLGESQLDQEAQQQGDVIDAFVGQLHGGVHGGSPTKAWEKLRCTAERQASGMQMSNICKYG